MRKIALAGCALVLASCASTMPPPSDVRLTGSSAEVAGCTRLGEVRGDHNLYGGMMYQLAVQAAESQIKSRAAQMGGNVVLMTSSTAGFMGANMAGVAYRCP